MKRIDKIAIILILYVIACVLPQAVMIDNSFAESFYFIREHVIIIAILLIILRYIQSSYTALLILGVIVYKIELIIYNIKLIGVPKEKYPEVANSMHIVDVVLISLYLIIFVYVINYIKFTQIVKKIILWIRTRNGGK